MIDSQNPNSRFTFRGQVNETTLNSAEEHNYSTEFNIPALKAGPYAVTISLLPPCLFSTPPCEIPQGPPDSAGTISIRDTASLGYSFQPREVAGDKAFHLFLIGKTLSCGDSFTNQSVSVQENILYLDFMNKPNPLVDCQLIHKDYGPTFTMPEMKAGTYQVFVTKEPYCATSTICPLGLSAPQLAGALVVTQTTSVLVHASKRQDRTIQTHFGMPGFKLSSKSQGQSKWVAPNGRVLYVNPME